MIVAKANVPLGTLEMTQEELDANIADLSFLKEAVLFLINPQVYADSDSLYNSNDPDEVRQWLYEMYSKGDHNYNMNFINKIFDK